MGCWRSGRDSCGLPLVWLLDWSMMMMVDLFFGDGEERLSEQLL